MTAEVTALAGSVYEKILYLILEGDGKNLALLRRQVQAMETVRVEPTGAGFFVTFPELHHIAPASAAFPRAYGDVNGYRAGEDEAIVGSILFIENGRVGVLEIYDFQGGLTVPLEQLVFRRVQKSAPPQAPL